MSSWTIWERSFLPNQALKYNSCLRWLISLNSVWSCPVVISCCLLLRAGSLAKPRGLDKTSALPRSQPSGRTSFQSERFLWRERVKLSLSQWRLSFFSACVAPLPIRGFLEFLHFFKNYFYFIHPHRPEIVVTVSIPLMDQIDLFKNNSYSMVSWAKKKKKKSKQTKTKPETTIYV